MEYWEQGWNGPGKPRETWAWAVLGSLLVHGLVVAVMLAVLQDKPAPRRVVVPVEAIALVHFKPGPAGGSGGRPGPVTRPEPAAPKPAPVRPHEKPRAKPPPPPKVKLAPPPPEPTTGPVIPTPAPPPAITRAKPSDTAAAGSRAGAPGATTGVPGSGQGGQGGGRGTGSGGGIGPGQGPGSGSGSALQGYLREIRRLLEKHKDYPQMARRRNIQGAVVVVFTIAPGGQIMAARVSRSSGHDLLDEAAQNTIRRVGQFPPFPAALNRQQLTVEVPLAFRLSND
ncbi:MAG: energy transducer TonB [Deltaproteobacteria bacterium]|nr:energy transducer TonB [Deltaproteobacteria bacterium]